MLFLPEFEKVEIWKKTKVFDPTVFKRRGVSDLEITNSIFKSSDLELMNTFSVVLNNRFSVSEKVKKFFRELPPLGTGSSK